MARRSMAMVATLDQEPKPGWKTSVFDQPRLFRFINASAGEEAGVILGDDGLDQTAPIGASRVNAPYSRPKPL